MALTTIPNGNPFGCHRVLAPKGVLPQPAEVLDNVMDRIWDNEILIGVDYLNIDAASFTQIKTDAQNDEKRIKKRILEIVRTRGKLHNPVTGSGGMLIGKVLHVGENHRPVTPIAAGDAIVSLVSLSLTPLAIDKILAIKSQADQARIEGQAVLFQHSLYAPLPDDIPQTLALSVLDVCGAPAQTAKQVTLGDTVVIIGAGGKSGLLCTFEARRRAGVTGTVIGIEFDARALADLKALALCDHLIQLDAGDALSCYNAISDFTHGTLADVVINCVNIPHTELASIIMCREGGVVYFFSMTTSFTQAALGAEGIAKDVTLIIGNGYTKGHAAMALDIMRSSSAMREVFQRRYA